MSKAGEPEILVIIPARGGSKGIPRKNLRPLAGKPLLHYSVSNALSSEFRPDVYVSSEDDEILFFARKLGAHTHRRNPKLAADVTTLDPVIFEAYEAVKAETGKRYDLIVTLQPTSPVLSVFSLDAAMRQMLAEPQVDTCISAVDDTHLTWKKDGKRFIPNYKERVNRQYLDKVYKETGGFLITRPEVISRTTRIGASVSLYELPAGEAVDIDSFHDWQVCEFYLKRKRILFVVTGYKEIGLGHVYNCLALANDILDHQVLFLVDERSSLGLEKIRASNYDAYQQRHGDILEDIRQLQPDVIINDVLDTSREYMSALRTLGKPVMNIEDLGEGAMLADVVVNAIYPERNSPAGHYYGPAYFCAREEFLLTPMVKIRPVVSNVLLTFGGVDPNNLTLKVLRAIYEHCVVQNIAINVVTGLGYSSHETLSEFTRARVHRNVSNISEHMHDCDLAFTSAGRTTYELALLGVPSVILAQNERELTHFFADEVNGFENLGLGASATEETILGTFISLCADPGKRSAMQAKMVANDIRNGKRNVLRLLRSLLEK